MSTPILPDEDILAEYEAWLKSRAYVYATVQNRVQAARQVLRTYPEGLPDESVALEEMAASRRTRASRKAMRTMVRSFYGYLESQGAL